MASPRISRVVSLFNIYVIDTTVYLDVVAPGPGGVANYVRLGISVAERDEWVQRHDEWVAFYPTYTNLVTRTVPVTAQKKNLMNEFIEFAQPVLNQIAASPEIVEDDFAVFNIKQRDEVPTPRPFMDTVPYPEVLPVGGGRIKATVRVQEDSSRASMQPDADSIEIRYTIGDTPPASQEEAEQQRSYRKAIRVLDFGQANAGQRLYAFFRWQNETDEAKSGPWSTMVQTVIA